MPIEWSRFYAGDLTVDSVLGRGWVLPWEQSLRRRGSFIYLTDNQGREVPFVTVRSFSYADGLMVNHSNALGLGCHYRWEAR
ncbi:hypothetical protein GPJ81_10600 [Pseudomonas alkylphenolica]|uniref:DUF6531 domain-containing protein n=1 Tax=Pseudomonas alkylphenolica TaxID=237609 RepID=A0A6I6H8Y8_9PSED|nr:hypothetical protein GPJ81_10600 [Pseudomonas alkylphenolica]